MSLVMDMLKETGAVIADSHFVLASGKHAGIYINKDALYPHTSAASVVCRDFAEKVKGLPIDVVVGPALGGIILSQWTAFHLSELRSQEIFGVYTEKSSEGGQVFTRGYEKFVAGKNALVVEDIITTGDSARKVVDAIRSAGGAVAAVCVMVNRNPDEVTEAYFGAPLFALAEFPIEAHEERNCPLCKAGVAVNATVGHGRKYLAAQQASAGTALLNQPQKAGK